MSTIRGFGAENIERTVYDEHLKDFMAVNVRQAIAYSGPFTLTHTADVVASQHTLCHSCATGYCTLFTFVPNLVTALVLYYGGQLVLVQPQQLSAGNLFSFMLYNSSLSSQFNMIGTIWTGLASALGAADKVFDLIHRVPNLPPHGGSVRT